MTTPAQAGRPRREIAHWVIGGCCAVALHVGGVLAVLAKWEQQPDNVAAAPVILLDLSPLPAAPEEPQTELPPGPQRTEAEPPPPALETPKETVEAKAEPEPEPPVPEPAVEPPKPEPPSDLAVMPPPKPKVTPPKPAPKAEPKRVERKPEKEKPKRERQASVTTRPPPSERQSPRAAASVLGNQAPANPNAMPNWKSLVAARLQSNKRYPNEARSRGEQGVATLVFSIDRSGRAHGARIAHSSGSSALDQETLALLQRAQPFPPPPPEVRGASISIVVPIRYNIR